MVIANHRCSSHGLIYAAVYYGVECVRDKDPQRLLFEEAFWDTAHKYHRPFRLTLDLQDSHFCALDLAEQHAFLCSFAVRRRASAGVADIAGQGTGGPDLPAGREGHSKEPALRTG